MREFQEVLRCVNELFTVPNDCLPVSFRDGRSGSRSLASLNKISDKRDKISPHKRRKQKKAENIAVYAKLVESESDLTPKYTNNRQLYKNQMAFYKGLAEAGWFDEEESDD
jgi:hypothetical protein